MEFAADRKTPPLLSRRAAGLKKGLRGAPKTAVQPAVDVPFRAVAEQLTPARQPCGTQKSLLTVASSRTWRGSQAFVAQDQIFNATCSGRSPQGGPSGRRSTPLQRIAGTGHRYLPVQHGQNKLAGGRGGIRTLGTVARTHALQACRLIRSRTLPRGKIIAWPISAFKAVCVWGKRGKWRRGWDSNPRSLSGHDFSRVAP